MIKSIERFYKKRIRGGAGGVTSDVASEESLRLATAALLIEVTKADQQVTQEELLTVSRSLASRFSLSEDETQELVSLATKQAEEAVSFYQFTHLINKGFTYEEKTQVVHLLWDVVFADQEMEQHEEHYVRKIADLLHVSHRDFITAKLNAKNKTLE